ncbi:MAG: O-antigen ligase family protein [Sumerlaeia bacterium]
MSDHDLRENEREPQDAEATASEDGFCEDRLPTRTVMASSLLLGALALAHFLALTPFTHNLDDVKYLTMWSGGAIALMVYCAMVAFGRAALPPRIIFIPYVGYVLTLVVSTLFASESYSKWIGWEMVTFHTSLAGWFLLGTATAATMRSARWTARYWVVVALVTCGFGIFHFFGGLEWIYDKLPPLTPGQESPPMRALIFTFAQSRDMLSTILNKQFFANFLAVMLPVCLAAVVLNFHSLNENLRKGLPITNPAAWVLASSLGVVFCAFCIFQTFSKASLFGLPLVFLAFAILVPLCTSYRIRIPAWPLAASLLAIMILSTLAVAWAELVDQFRSVSTSMESREIIWQGAINMWKDNPILGAGPGSFRLEFPKYRSPDYHLYDISNVTLYAHNRFLDLLAENGIVGFGFYVAFLGAIGWLGFRVILRCPSQNMRVLMIGYLLGLGYFYLGNLATPMMRWPVGAVTAHLVLGITTGLIMTGLRGNLPPPQEMPGVAVPGPQRQNFQWTRLSIAAATAAVLAFGYLLYIHDRGKHYFAASVANNQGVLIISRTPMSEKGLGISKAQFINYAGNEMEKARKLFDTAMEENPNFITSYYKQAHVYNRLASLYEAAGNREKSEEMQLKGLEVYADLRELAPDYSEIHYNLAVINADLADDYKQQAQAMPAGSEQRQAMMEKARATMEEAIVSVDRAAELSNKINVYYIRGLFYERLAAMHPEGSEKYLTAIANAARSYETARDAPFARVLQDENQRETEEAQKRLAAGKAAGLYNLAKMYPEAGEAYWKVYQENPNDSQPLNRAIVSFVLAKDLDRAEELVKEGLRRNPLNPDFQLVYAELLAEQAASRENQDLAWKALEQALFVSEVAERVPDYLDKQQQERLTRIIQRGHGLARQLNQS